MDSRLYVGNLSDDVSLSALRQLFADFGTVADVELVVDRQSGRIRGHAFVTMGSPAEARAAIEGLNGVSFDDRKLRVNAAGDRDPSAAKAAAAARITSQFRERLNMAYELDCAGVVLSIKMFPEDPHEQSWRVEASVHVADAEKIVLAASAPTRGAALEEIARTWSEKNATVVDWAAVRLALTGVRAI